MRPSGTFLIAISSALAAVPAASAGILEDYPHLRQYVHQEPDNHLHFGIGLTPLQIMQSKAGLSFSFFQLHWITRRMDFEIMSAAYGRSISSDPNSKVSAFTFRTAPKIKLIEGLSIGPMAGFEFVSFSDVEARLVKGSQGTPWEAWSSRGWIYGATISQTFRLSRNYQFKLNQSVYRQTYSTEGTSRGWMYLYRDDSLNDNPAPIAPGLVFLFEFSILY